MAWTAAEEARVRAIEVMLNTVQEAVNKLATKQQLNASTNIRQQEIDELKQRVSDLETQVAALQSSL